MLTYLRKGHGLNPLSDISNETKYEQIFLRQLHFSRFRAKLNKSSYEKIFEPCHSELTLNYKFHHLLIKLLHTTQVMWEARL